MGATTQTLQGRKPVRLPAWIVVGVGLALAGALAVATISDGDTSTTIVREPAVVIDSGAGVDDAREMAAVKAARATGTEFQLVSAPEPVQSFEDQAAEIAWLKAQIRLGQAER